MTCVLGLGAIVLAAGSIEQDTTTTRDSIILAMAGLSMMVGGCFIYKLFESLPDILERLLTPASFNADELIGSMAYNARFNSWMTVVDYKNDENWTFVLCSEDGRPTSSPVKSKRNITKYNWIND